MGRAAGPWWDQLTEKGSKCTVSWSKGTNKISAIIKWHMGSNGVIVGGNFNLTSNLQTEKRTYIIRACFLSCFFASKTLFPMVTSWHCGQDTVTWGSWWDGDPLPAQPRPEHPGPDQSDASTWPVLTNQRPALRSHDPAGLMASQWRRGPVLGLEFEIVTQLFIENGQTNSQPPIFGALFALPAEI